MRSLRQHRSTPRPLALRCPESARDRKCASGVRDPISLQCVPKTRLMVTTSNLCYDVEQLRSYVIAQLEEGKLPRDTARNLLQTPDFEKLSVNYHHAQAVRNRFPIMRCELRAGGTLQCCFVVMRMPTLRTDIVPLENLIANLDYFINPTRTMMALLFDVDNMAQFTVLFKDFGDFKTLSPRVFYFFF